MVWQIAKILRHKQEINEKHKQHTETHTQRDRVEHRAFQKKKKYSSYGENKFVAKTFRISRIRVEILE